MKNGLKEFWLNSRAEYINCQGKVHKLNDNTLHFRAFWLYSGSVSPVRNPPFQLERNSSELRLIDANSSIVEIVRNSNNDLKNTTAYLRNTITESALLRKLVLSDNLLTRFDKYAFSHLRALHTLDLSRNFLVVVIAGLFDRNSRLQKLNLESNLIDDVRCDFSHLPELTELLMSGNQLNQLKRNIFERFLTIKRQEGVKPYFDISKNRIECNCHLAWLIVDRDRIQLDIKLGFRELCTKSRQLAFMRKQCFVVLGLKCSQIMLTKFYENCLG